MGLPIKISDALSLAARTEAEVFEAGVDGMKWRLCQRKVVLHRPTAGPHRRKRVLRWSGGGTEVDRFLVRAARKVVGPDVPRAPHLVPRAPGAPEHAY